VLPLPQGGPHELPQAQDDEEIIYDD
jgi:hypothetical protein